MSMETEIAIDTLEDYFALVGGFIASITAFVTLFTEGYESFSVQKSLLRRFYTSETNQDGDLLLDNPNLD